MRSLVVDDEFVALSKMIAILQGYGPCDTATSGAQALELLRGALDRNSPYHLITIDINMPGANGLDLVLELRQEEEKRGASPARKLIVSADSRAENVLQAADEKCDGFLVKPVKRAVLAEKLAQLKLAPARVVHNRQEC